MTRFNNIDHPAVEIKPPLDGGDHRFEIPQDTTLFFWTAIAVGTKDRIPQISSTRGSRLFNTGVIARESMSLSVSIEGESIPLIGDSHYREGQYRGLAWWLPFKPSELPVSIDVQFEMNGEPPTDRGEPIALWTEKGERIQWGETREGSVILTPSNSPTSEFQTQQENLWGRHTVYLPQ